MWSSGDWQAAAEIAAFVWVLANAIVWGLFYRAQASFVTRAEHGKFVERIERVENGVGDIKIDVAKLMTSEEASELGRRLGKVENVASNIEGKLEGIENQARSTNSMLKLINQHLLNGKGQ